MPASRSPSVYILAGPEQGKRAAFIARLRSEMQERDRQAPECHRLYAHETDPAALLLLARNASLFASSRIIEYHGAETLKGKPDIAPLVAYIASPAPDAVLLLITESFGVDKGLEDAVGKDCKLTFFEMFANEKDRLVRTRLQAAGITIDDDGLERILELVENESQALEAACNSLVAGFPPGTKLGSAEVEAAVARNRREDAFSLYERMAQSDLASCLAALDAVLSDRQGGAVQIIAALVWSFRRLIRIHAACAAGSDFESACLKQGMRGKTIQRINRAAMERYRHSDCERILLLLSRVDGLVRATGSIFERSLLHLALYGIVVRRGDLDPGAQTGAFL